MVSKTRLGDDVIWVPESGIDIGSLGGVYRLITHASRHHYFLLHLANILTYLFHVFVFFLWKVKVDDMMVTSIPLNHHLLHHYQHFSYYDHWKSGTNLREKKKRLLYGKVINGGFCYIFPQPFLEAIKSWLCGSEPLPLLFPPLSFFYNNIACLLRCTPFTLNRKPHTFSFSFPFLEKVNCLQNTRKGRRCAYFHDIFFCGLGSFFIWGVVVA